MVLIVQVVRGWMAFITLYNVASGIALLVYPKAMDKIFPDLAMKVGMITGSEGNSSSVLSRVLGWLALTIAGVRIAFVIDPQPWQIYFATLWTFVIFESMFFTELYMGTVQLRTIAFGIAMGMISVLLMAAAFPAIFLKTHGD
eukprot:gnl/MRDRNA2_/MRDRNA2_242442_c0_seq1.p1 gnl/MRDRNA2_/MRDRNA2_242442_c0~~gnl/MRDRNA2_/MRDRNA2_242442_c0_seq1.p1  ORF type:complete len:143 (+),score=8.64 gnl/MRDRNA2_/MRDRNA2_242442_c0_seq1:124-552(+)